MLKFLPGLKHTNNTVTAVVFCSSLFFSLCIYTLVCRHIHKKKVLLFETPVGLSVCLAQWLAFSVLSCDPSRTHIDPFLSNATLYCIYGFKLWLIPTHVLIRNKFSTEIKWHPCVRQTTKYLLNPCFIAAGSLNGTLTWTHIFKNKAVIVHLSSQIKLPETESKKIHLTSVQKRLEFNLLFFFKKH